MLALVAALALSQMNAEVLKPSPWKGGVSLGADGSLFLSRGNVVFLDAGGALRAQWQSVYPREEGDTTSWVRQRVFVVVNGRYSDTARGPIVSQYFAHARWTAMWTRRLGSDVFAQYQANVFMRQQARAVGGPGVRVEAVRTRHFALWGGSAVMFEYDRLSPLAGSSERLETFDVRWSNYLTARLSLLEDRLLVQNTTYAQPRFDDFTDARFLNETELLAKVVDPLMLGVTATVLYDTQPPESVVPADLRLLLVVRFTLDLSAP